VDLAAGCETRALLDDGSGAHEAAPTEHAAVTHDRTGFDDGPGADATAVDHGAGADDHAVLDDEIVVRQQVQDGVLQELDVAADADRTPRAGRPTATTSLGSIISAGTRVPSPRKTRSPTRAPGMSVEAFPISQRSPTVAPITVQR